LHLEPEDKDGYLDDDGCPELDNDLDGILDTADKCPNQPEDPEGFEDADEAADLDNDKDNLADLEDQCPNEPGLPTAIVPDARKAASVVVTDRKSDQRSRFTSSSTRTSSARRGFPILDAVAEVLQKFRRCGSRSRATPTTRDRRPTTRSFRIEEPLRFGNISSQRHRTGALVSHGYGLSRPLVPTIRIRTAP